MPSPLVQTEDRTYFKVVSLLPYASCFLVVEVLLLAVLSSGECVACFGSCLIFMDGA